MKDKMRESFCSQLIILLNNNRSSGAEPPASCPCGYRGNMAGSEWMPMLGETKKCKKKEEKRFGKRRKPNKNWSESSSSPPCPFLNSKPVFHLSHCSWSVMAPPTYSQGLLEVSALSTVNGDCGLLSSFDLTNDPCPALLLLFSYCIVELLAERLKWLIYWIIF